ncbi:MAG: UpxY family transcription antiterminator [Acidobacteriia bacterium]|nr:UpxY family transcription antiterminator [Terriglobia bacterium]
MSTGKQACHDTAPLSAAMLAEPRWYAIQTRSRHERIAASQLTCRGLKTYLPLTRELHRWSDRNKMVELPLFAGYLFVRMAASVEARVDVLRTNGVVRLVGVRGEGVPIPDDQIEGIQKILTNDIPFVNHPFLRIGQRVRIHGGCMDGLEGILLGRNGNRSLVVCVDAIERSLLVRLEGYGVEGVSTPGSRGAQEISPACWFGSIPEGSRS